MKSKQPPFPMPDQVVDLSEFDLPTDLTDEIQKTLAECGRPPTPSVEPVVDPPSNNKKGWFRSILGR